MTLLLYTDLNDVMMNKRQNRAANTNFFLMNHFFLSLYVSNFIYHSLAPPLALMAAKMSFLKASRSSFFDNG